jgi:hypothetical protein
MSRFSHDRRIHPVSDECEFGPNVRSIEHPFEVPLGMIAKLTKELAAALNATGGRELEVVDPETQRTYFLVDSETHRRAMEALRPQHDRSAVAEGLVQMEEGQGKPLDQAFSDLRSRLGFPQAQ